MSFTPFDCLDLYVRRPLDSAEDAAATLMPPMPSDTETDAEQQYRRICPSFPLHVAVHAGGTFNVYGILLITPTMGHTYSDVSIDISFLGTSQTLWKDGFIMRGRKRVFVDIRKSLLKESDSFPWDHKAPYIHLPFSFFIATAPEGNGLPITFTSPSATVSYSIRAHVTYNDPKHGKCALTLHAPVKVAPPWLNAPAPATPALGPQEDGTRWVLDLEDGSCQGKVSLVRHQQVPDSEEGLHYLRTKVLTNLTEQPRAYLEGEPQLDILIPTSPVDAGPSVDQDHVLPRTVSRESSIGTMHSPNDVPNSPPMIYTEVDPLAASFQESNDLVSSEKHAASSSTFEELNRSVCFDPAVSPISHPGSLFSNETLQRRDDGPHNPESSYNSEADVGVSGISQHIPSYDQITQEPLKTSANPVLKFFKSLVSSITEIPKFRVIFPCTMVGPGSRVPVDVFIQSVPQGHFVHSVEAVLVAQVVCTAFGAVHEDRTELACVRKMAGDDRSNFKERLWLLVPGSNELDQYGANFKAPLVELNHMMVLNLYTCRKKRTETGWNQETRKLHNLGSVSMVLTR
ncbi:hypothetical protein BJ741DRAFT_621375 [Chytriomyces cf. hyalinus JEL632]|nr:hypothetical protein BJ741DRAFT_621375 [Chytriomyces cf. hyalinus JEL632]